MKETKVYVEKIPKSCEDCLFCEFFSKDAHGKGKHEVACYFEGFIGNMLNGNQLSPRSCRGILQSLKTHDRGLVKKVCDKISRNVRVRKIQEEWYAIETDLRAILYEIQKEFEDEK